MSDIFFNPSYNTMWTAFGAIGQVGAAFLAIVALIYSLRTFTASLKNSHYAELDRMYQDLLNIKLGNPHLRHGNVKRDDDEEAQYDIYAFMVWNFLETIRDRCDQDKELCRTWYPVIAGENRLHREWLERKENQDKFKRPFLEFIQKDGFLQDCT